MKYSMTRTMLIVALTAPGALGQARSFMALDGEQEAAPTTGNTSIVMEAGSTARVMVWMQDSGGPTQQLNAYQIIMPFSAEPQGGASGAITYVDNNPGMGGGDSIVIDTLRDDWVFDDQPVVLTITYNETPPTIFGLFYATIQGFFTTPGAGGGILYVCEFDVEASADASGEFELRFNLPPKSPPLSAYFNPAGGEYVIDEYQALTITVAGGCKDPCSDGDACTVDDACDGDTCVGDPVDCSDAGGECAIATCDAAGADGNCDLLKPLKDGTPCDGGAGACKSGACVALCIDPCDDGDVCTIEDACDGDTCVGTPVDCSRMGGECVEATCSPDGQEGNCDITKPLRNGTECDGGAGVCRRGVCVTPECVDPCDDGDACTVDDACEGDTCVGVLVDCTAAGDDCNVASCSANGDEGNCDVLDPINDGLACNDGAGICDGGVCVEPGCEDPCDDGDACTVDDACEGDTCIGVLVDCTAAGDDCNVASCSANGDEGNCDVLDPINDGLACNDGAGICDGGVCVEPGCEDPCDDGDACTVDDACEGDTCVGLPVDCSGAGDDCNAASCILKGEEGNCDLLEPINDGMTCNDGAGICDGGVCVEPGCEDPCDDGNACTIDDACDGDLCQGQEVDCSDAGDDCTAASCSFKGEEGNCDNLDPINDGLPCNDGAGVCENGACVEPACEDPCDDGQACTIDDACDGDLCVGQEVDCSGESDDCNAASCSSDGEEGNCDNREPINEGMPCDDGAGVCNNGECVEPGCIDPCDDGDVCTIEDRCIDDICIGDPVDCSAEGGECTQASCDADGDGPNCANMIPINEGEPCADGDGVCVGGSCEPLPDDACSRTMIIKQGACPAPLNAGSNGVLPLALTGEDDFDVYEIDIASLRLSRCGYEDGVAPLDGPPGPGVKFKDLNHPHEGPVGCSADNGCACNDDQSSDGITDLSLKFSVADLADVLGLDEAAQDDIIVLELRGHLLDGTPFCARDCVRIVGARRGRGR